MHVDRNFSTCGRNFMFISLFAMLYMLVSPLNFIHHRFRSYSQLGCTLIVFRVSEFMTIFYYCGDRNVIRTNKKKRKETKNGNETQIFIYFIVCRNSLQQCHLKQKKQNCIEKNTTTEIHYQAQIFVNARQVWRVAYSRSDVYFANIEKYKIKEEKKFVQLNKGLPYLF